MKPIVRLLLFVLCFSEISVHAQADLRVVARVPSGSQIVVYGNVTYRYYRGVYYRPHTKGFMIVAPPYGIRVNVLPPGFRVVAIGPTRYFVYNGVYYLQRGVNEFEVVDTPRARAAESTVEIATSQPSHTNLAETFSIYGKLYYRVGEKLYEKSLTENGEEKLLEVGKIEKH